MMTVMDRSPATAEDAELLASAESGDALAFRAFYDRHARAIRGYALGRVGPDAADDIVSETFAEAWRTQNRFDRRSRSARPWLFGIATNVVARHRECEARWLEANKSAKVVQPVIEPTVYEFDPQLASAIGNLTPVLRDVLLLTAVAEMSVVEAARTLGTTPTTARVRLLRARRQVRESLRKGARS